jgi:hypothetical protein
MRAIYSFMVSAALVMPLTNCAQLQTAFEVANFTTASVANPVTPQMLNNLENGAIIVFAGLNAYRQSCVQKAIPQECRTVIRQMQVYTRQIPPLLAQLRTFVRTNDQVNAVIVYNSVANLVATLRTTATQNNVRVGA